MIGPDAGGQLATRPSPLATVAPGWYNNDPSGLSAATIVDADSLNAQLAEGLEFLTLTGQTPSKTNVTQWALACLMLFGMYASDSGGTTNAYVVSGPLALPSLRDGQKVSFVTTRANTGAATLAAGGLGAQPLTRADGTALQPNDVLPGMVSCIYAASLSAFCLVARSVSLVPLTSGQFTSAGAFSITAPSGVSSVIMEGNGGGGGAGFGASAGIASGGSAGAWGTLTAHVIAGQVITGSVGAGGVAGTAGVNGGAGGDTTIDLASTIYTAGGGPGGLTIVTGTSANSPSPGNASGPWSDSSQGQEGSIGFEGGDSTHFSGNGGSSPNGGLGGIGGAGIGGSGGSNGGGGGGSGGGSAAGIGGTGRVKYAFYA